jgi:hypothetical protein
MVCQCANFCARPVSRERPVEKDEKYLENQTLCGTGVQLTVAAAVLQVGFSGSLVHCEFRAAALA